MRYVKAAARVSFCSSCSEAFCSIARRLFGSIARTRCSACISSSRRLSPRSAAARLIQMEALDEIALERLLEQFLRARQIARQQHAPPELVQYQWMLRRLQFRLPHEPCRLVSPALHERFVRRPDQRRYTLIVPRTCVRHSTINRVLRDSIQLRKFNGRSLWVESVAAVGMRARVQRNVEQGAQVAPRAIRCRPDTKGRQRGVRFLRSSALVDAVTARTHERERDRYDQIQRLQLECVTAAGRELEQLGPMRERRERTPC